MSPQQALRLFNIIDLPGSQQIEPLYQLAGDLPTAKDGLKDRELRARSDTHLRVRASRCTYVNRRVNPVWHSSGGVSASGPRLQQLRYLV